MGWLFGRKKKIPKVPLPEGHTFDEETLQFPAAPPSEKVIELEEVKKAAGVEESPEEGPSPIQEPIPKMPALPTKLTKGIVEEPGEEQKEPCYVKVGVYRRMIGEIDNLKENLSELDNAQLTLESAEYNEEHKFDNLKRKIKSIHDRLLDADQMLFKTKGD